MGRSSSAEAGPGQRAIRTDSGERLHRGGTLEDTLAHFGVKGMKWGVRRPVGSSGRVTGGSSHPSSSDAERAKEYHKKATTAGVHVLSNQELEHLTKRMNLEQQYTRLRASGNKRAAGQKIAKDILLQVGKQHISKVLSEGIAAISG